MQFRNAIFLMTTAALAWILCLPYSAAAQTASTKGHALLVGCTTYANMPTKTLEGPGNDVLLTRELLVNRFGFLERNIVILSEAAGNDKLRPTRVNIEREFRRLADVAQPGEQVVIWLAGHGTRQPDNNPNDFEDFEPDGLDEIFLPADAGNPDEAKGKIPNAILDDEFRIWLKDIQRKQAFVCFIVDSCHAGTMTRGEGEEVPRGIPPDELFSAATLDKAKKRAAQTTSRINETIQSPSILQLDDDPNLVALYAVGAYDQALEVKLPRHDPKRKYYGLFSYTLNQILRQANEPLTYNELVQRVYYEYLKANSTYPLPFIEGKARHQEVFGRKAWPKRSQTLLSVSEGSYSVNAGALHGVSKGSILAVFSPPGVGAAANAALGYVKVVDPGMFRSDVEVCSFETTDAKKELPLGGRCEVAFVDYGIDRLKVAVVPGEADAQDAEIQEVKSKLEKLASAKDAVIRLVNKKEDADWVVVISDGKVFHLSYLDYLSREGNKTIRERAFGPKAVNELEDALRRVFRARNLLNITGNAITRGGDSGLNVELELVRFKTKADQKGVVVAWDGTPPKLQAGDVVGFNIHNRGRYAVDVSLLLVTSDFAIEPFFPSFSAGTDNRLLPGKSLLTPRAKVTAGFPGLDQMVVIAVKADDRSLPVDFTCLAQPSLTRARSATRGDARRGLDSPLGTLFQNAIYGQGNTRGLAQDVFEEYSMGVVSWEAARPEE